MSFFSPLILEIRDTKIYEIWTQGSPQHKEYIPKRGFLPNPKIFLLILDWLKKPRVWRWPHEISKSKVLKPSNVSHGRNQRKTLRIARTKIGPKIPFKIRKMKNISAQDRRWFYPNPRIYWCKSRVYKVWKLTQHPPTLWRIGGTSHFLSSPLLHHEAHPHLSKSNYG
jgi:hypothetical protein